MVASASRTSGIAFYLPLALTPNLELKFLKKVVDVYLATVEALLAFSWV